jgi:hypothetical protein
MRHLQEFMLMGTTAGHTVRFYQNLNTCHTTFLKSGKVIPLRYWPLTMQHMQMGLALYGDSCHIGAPSHPTC